MILRYFLIFFVRSASKVLEKEDSPIPSISYGPSPVLVQASGAVDLMCNEKQGRFLIVSLVQGKYYIC